MRATGVDGVMAARGLLAKYVGPSLTSSIEMADHADLRSSPALFAGYDRTPRHAVEQFINLSLDYGFIYPLLSVERDPPPLCHSLQSKAARVC